MKVAINLMLALAGAAGAVAVTEAALRHTRFGEISGAYSKNQERRRFLTGTIPGYFRPDPASGYDITEGRPPAPHRVFATAGETFEYPVWSNELGCFDDPYRGEQDFVLMVGDSFTWGFAPFEDKWGRAIEKLIGQRAVKCGVAGYGTKQELLKARKIAAKLGAAPKAIIVGYFLDLADDYIFPRYTIINGYLVPKVILESQATGKKRIRSDEELARYVDTKLADFREQPNDEGRRSLLQWSLDSFVLPNVLGRACSRIGRKLGILSPVQPATGGKDGAAWMQQAWTEHLSVIDEMKSLAEQLDARLLFVMIPPKEMIYEFLKTVSGDAAAGMARVRAHLEKRAVPFLDLTDGFRRFANQQPRPALDPVADLYWQFDGHWNVKGNRLAGLLVSRWLLQNAFFPIAERESKLAQVEKMLQEFR